MPSCRNDILLVVSPVDHLYPTTSAETGARTTMESPVQTVVFAGVAITGVGGPHLIFNNLP